jgi:iron complex transport system ATP-binding protein
MHEVLAVQKLSVHVPNRELVSELNLSLMQGMFVAVLGRNGSGKSLSMLTLAGLRPPANGTVRLNGRALDDWPSTERAKHLALMPQILDDRFPQTVQETALIGRYPHVSRFGWESQRDLDIAGRALAAVDLDGFAERDILGLSGGERRRLAIAQVLTQDPDVFLLDEPTNHLDPQHQQDAMALFKGLCDSGKTIVASLHDVNLACRFADHCLLLDGDGGWAFGQTDRVLNSETLTSLYGVTMREIQDGDDRWFVADGRPTPHPNPLHSP